MCHLCLPLCLPFKMSQWIPPESFSGCPATCEKKQEEPSLLENFTKDLHLSDSTEQRQDDEISLLTDGIIDPDEITSTFKPNAAVNQLPRTPVPAIDMKAAKMLSLKSQQQEILTHNVDGILFQTTKTTLQADPSSILACLASTCKHGLSCKNFDFFLNRNPKHYGFILDYLRNNCKIIPSTLHVMFLHWQTYMKH